MELRESFDSAAKIYDDARPSYPDEVIDWIINRTGISIEERLLEIGSGTGQATIKFAERGYNIHCVEMGKNLAELLMQKCKHLRVSVDISSFEAWNPQSSFETSFIFSATAFHWIDYNIKYKKCYDLLKDNGYLVLLWNLAAETDIPAVKRAYEILWEYYPEKRQTPKFEGDIKNQRKLEIINSGLFDLEDYIDYQWNPAETRDKFTKGFFSQSSYLSLDEAKRRVVSAKVEELFRDLDEVITTDFYTTAYIAKKRL